MNVSVPSVESVHLTSVRENESRFTKIEVKKARMARELTYRLGYISTKDLCEMIRKGMMINLSVTAQDVIHARIIYGPSIGDLKGKTVSRPTKDNTRVDSGEEHLVAVDLELHCDVMTVDSVQFFVSVASPLGLAMVSYIPDRSLKPVAGALFNHIHQY